jgi:sulfhydrogenase subunit beta (sulfur reductase)
MKKKVIKKESFGAWVNELKKQGDLFGPKKKDVFYSFQKVEDVKDLALDYNTTILPLKKFFTPAKDEVIMTFNLKTGEMKAPKTDPVKEIIILGAHACDMQGLVRLDTCWKEGNPDNTYLAKRAKSTIIGVTCNPDEFCFCSSVGSNDHKEGFDIFLSDLGQSWLAESFTEKGDKLLALAKTEEAGMFDDELAYKAKAKCAQLPGEQIAAKVEELPLLCMDGEDLAFWKDDLARRCLACGSCTNVCPTCYCFDVQENVELNLTDGSRLRSWDSCQLEGFTEVAGGEKFMHEQATRQKHRFYRKFRWLTTKYGGKAFCVGCGRCRRQCTAEIGVVETANKLSAGVKAMK